MCMVLCVILFPRFKNVSLSTEIRIFFCAFISIQQQQQQQHETSKCELRKLIYFYVKEEEAKKPDSCFVFCWRALKTSVFN